MTTSNSPYDAQASTNYKEAFALFDKRGNQRVQLESLGDLLRACGQNPTLAEIRDLEKNVGGDCTSPFPVLSPYQSPKQQHSKFQSGSGVF
jgi:Ca2+-binding EF-hand superfamily protein